MATEDDEASARTLATGVRVEFRMSQTSTHIGGTLS